jgi:hypothetical protein
MIGLQDGRRVTIGPARQLWLPFEIKGGLFTTKADTASPVEDEQLMEKVVDRDNLLTALGQTRRWDTTVGYSHRAGSIHPAGSIAGIAARLGRNLF